MSDPSNSNPTSTDDKKSPKQNPETPKSAEVTELDEVTLDNVVGGVKLPVDEGNENCNCNCG